MAERAVDRGLPGSVGHKCYFLQNYETSQLGTDAERAAMRETFRVG